MTRDLFPGFSTHCATAPGGRMFLRRGGSGPPVVLLHGFPQCHAMWSQIAPALAASFTVVALDLRGYGQSSAPDSASGENYSKRRMAEDVVHVMRGLGYDRFRIVGHDRGGRVAYRLALDHPNCVEKLAVLDIIPTVSVWRNIRAGATPGAHWEFLARAAPEPETQIGRAPDDYFHRLLMTWSQGHSLGAFDADALDCYRRAWRDPRRVHAMCEDYRAGATLDLQADDDDLTSGRRIACPVLVVSGEFYLTAPPGGPAAPWRETFAPHCEAVAIESGHFLAEENPSATRDALAAFL